MRAIVILTYSVMAFIGFNIASEAALILLAITLAVAFYFANIFDKTLEHFVYIYIRNTYYSTDDVGRKLLDIYMAKEKI